MKPKAEKWRVVFSNKPKGYVGIATMHGGEYDSEDEADAAMKIWTSQAPHRYSATMYKPGEKCPIRTS